MKLRSFEFSVEKSFSLLTLTISNDTDCCCLLPFNSCILCVIETESTKKTLENFRIISFSPAKMICFLSIIVGIVLLKISVSQNITPATITVHNESDELIFAHVIFRHGARNIEKTYPNDPYKDEKFWPEGLGQLTNVNNLTIIRSIF